MVNNSCSVICATQQDVLCSVGRASRYNRVKETQFDALLILSIFPGSIQNNRQSSKKNKYQMLYTYICTS